MREADLERILSAWSEPESGNVSGYGRTHGEPGIRCADFAAHVRVIQKELEEAKRLLALLVRRGAPRSEFGSFVADFACKECVPHSDMLIDGFRCAYHAAIAFLKETPK